MKRVLTWVGLSAVVFSTMVLGAQAGALSDATSSALGGIEVGGYLDTSWTFNIDEPRPANGGNVGRIFDVDHDDIVDINLLQLYIDNLPQDVGSVGFRFDVGIGEDATAIGGDFDQGGGGFLADDSVNIYQAFLSYIAPVGNGLTIDVGRFATWHGYEVIESPGNDNFSRSLLFGYAVPFTHTGLRLTYPINDMVEVSGGVTQGWDTVEDNNDGKTFHLAVRYTPTEDIYIQNSFAYGPEMTGNDSDYLFLYDLVATWNLTEDWTIGANFDWANNEDAIGGTADAEWWGVGAYVRYDVNEDLYLAVRGEYFSDDDAVRLPQGAPGTAANEDMWEVTFTAGYQIAEDLLGRFEYRHDEADSNIFFDGTSQSEDAQDTIALELIYSF